MTQQHTPRRNDLTGEHTVGDAGQLVLALLFALTWIADTFFLRYTTFLNPHVPLVVRLPLGGAVLVLAAYLANTSLSIVFGEVRDPPCVIRESVFDWMRHPMYLSEILLYLGLLMFSLSLAAALVWVVAIGFLHTISRHEEKLLLARFGEAYAQYMREVPMWIPRLRKMRG
jgi:protein-S-isoprenylcysteine O-methyltransferase Ste14